jgi:hypothetical protein
LVDTVAWLMVNAPVDELYASGAVAERDVEEILLLKTVQSPLARYPLVAPLAASIESVPAENWSGEDTVAWVTTPAFPYRRPLSEPMVAVGVTRAPVAEMVVEPVPPNAAVIAVERPVNSVVEVAFASVVFPVTARVLLMVVAPLAVRPLVKV